MAEKEKKKLSIRPKKVYTRKLKLSEITELSIAVFIVPRENETKVCSLIEQNRGVVLSKFKGKGLSRASVLTGIGAFLDDVSVVFSMARVEEVKDLVTNVSYVLNLDKPGNGKAFVIDVDGYMGAKAPFIEKW